MGITNRTGWKIGSLIIVFCVRFQQNTPMSRSAAIRALFSMISRLDTRLGRSSWSKSCPDGTTSA